MEYRISLVMTHFTVLIAVLPITLMTNENDILVKMDWLDW